MYHLRIVTSTPLQRTACCTVRRRTTSVVLRTVVRAASATEARIRQDDRPSQQMARWFTSSTSTTTSPSSYSFKGDKMRIAIVGGGAAGLSSALHLAPLVEQGLVAGPIDVYDPGPTNCRDVGVGIWSTALDPFRESSQRPSHELVYDSMSAKHGTWIGDVGYRTPNGKWLMQSHLPTSQQEAEMKNMPYLLFLREKDMISSLQTALHLEEQQGNVCVHHGRRAKVQGLYEGSSECWSTNLLLQGQKSTEPERTERDYHLIIAADGMDSILRKRYGGHESGSRRLTGTSALPSPIDLPNTSSLSNMDYGSTTWDENQHREAVALQDRYYTVFRGNAHMSRKELKQDQEESRSFQTWGTGQSMRYATVPMMYPSPQGKVERQVWFITTNDDNIAQEPDPVKRRDMLIDTFSSWHDPICQTVLATPPEEILMERAIAHRHCMSPVLSFNTKVVRHLRGKRPPSSGEGPCIVFVGDAYMTVDPILAQGFTMAMESAAALVDPVRKSCLAAAATTHSESNNDNLGFHPIQLRRELKARQVRRIDRLIALLRSTELVQALGQPSQKTTGFLNTKVLRPLTLLTPNFIKQPVFDAVLRYSLGLGLFRRTQQEAK